jgi:regulator of protease activity HflC (stomatin/prohibitin superfamily)
MNYDDDRSLPANVLSGLAANKWKGVAGAAAVITGLSSFYIVDQTQMANVRRLGVAQYTSPVGPGLHFKAPFIDSADRIQVTQTALHIAPFKVTTVDNQEVTLDINFTYNVPKDRVNHLLYEIGGSGIADIKEQVTAVARDRAGQVMSAQNMVTVNAQRQEIIQPAIQKAIFTAVQQQFGLEPVSLQMTVTPSQAFITSNEAAVRAKNEAVAAENSLRTKQFEAQQAEATAKGKADAAVQAARGEAQATVMKAEADKTAAKLRGEGAQAELEAAMKPFGGDAGKYTNFILAQRYKGDVPQFVGAGSSNFLITPRAPAQDGR